MAKKRISIVKIYPYNLQVTSKSYNTFAIKTRIKTYPSDSIYHFIIYLSVHYNNYNSVHNRNVGGFCRGKIMFDVNDIFAFIDNNPECLMTFVK